MGIPRGEPQQVVGLLAILFYPQTWGWNSSLRLSMAQMMRAFLLATATIARFIPRPSRSALTHRLNGSDLVPDTRTTDRAPCTNSVRRCLSPRLLMPIKRRLSPLECCLGTSPIQAAICRPFLNSLPSPTAAMTAVAVLGPTPHMPDIRRHSEFALKTASMRRSKVLIRLSS